MNENKLPPCEMYHCLILAASLKFNISVAKARSRYGQYTIKQWNELLNN